jgi:hypothetical protein
MAFLPEKGSVPHASWDYARCALIPSIWWSQGATRFELKTIWPTIFQTFTNIGVGFVVSAVGISGEVGVGHPTQVHHPGHQGIHQSVAE